MWCTLSLKEWPRLSIAWFGLQELALLFVVSFHRHIEYGASHQRGPPLIHGLWTGVESGWCYSTPRVLRWAWGHCLEGLLHNHSSMRFHCGFFSRSANSMLLKARVLVQVQDFKAAWVFSNSKKISKIREPKVVYWTIAEVSELVAQTPTRCITH